MTKFSAFLEKTRKEEEKRSITDVGHEWLSGMAPITSISCKGSDGITRRFVCEALVDTGCELELVLPIRKVRQLNLKPRVSNSVIETLVAILPFGGTQELTEFEEVFVEIPFTGGADGVCGKFLRVWSNVSSSVEQSLGAEDLSPASLSPASAGDETAKASESSSIDEDSLTPMTSPSASGSSSEGYIEYSPVLCKQDNSQMFALIGFPGLCRLNLRVDARQKRLFGVGTKKVLMF